MNLKEGNFDDMKKFIINIIILIFIIILGMGTISSLAMQDYQENKAMTLRLSYFRYSNGQYVDGYALNTVGDEGESHHPIYQIMDESNNKNYYCLNAKSGESWLSGTVGASATYNRSYDLNSHRILRYNIHFHLKELYSCILTLGLRPPVM